MRDRHWGEAGRAPPTRANRRTGCERSSPSWEDRCDTEVGDAPDASAGLSARKKPNSAGSTWPLSATQPSARRVHRLGVACPGSPAVAAAGSQRARLRAATLERDRGGERELAGLVDHQQVERPAGHAVGVREVLVRCRPPRIRMPRARPRTRRRRLSWMIVYRWSPGSRASFGALADEVVDRARRGRPASSTFSTTAGLARSTPMRHPCRATSLGDHPRRDVGLAGAGRPCDREVELPRECRRR